MYVERNIVAYSCNSVFYENVTVCIVVLHVTVNIINMESVDIVAQQWVFNLLDYISLLTILMLKMLEQKQITEFSLFVALHVTVKKEIQGADKSLARPGRKQATATEDFVVHISYL